MWRRFIDLRCTPQNGKPVPADCYNKPTVPINSPFFTVMKTAARAFLDELPN